VRPRPSAGFRGVHVLVDDDPRWPHPPGAQAEAALRGGAAVIQVRAKHGSDRSRLVLARDLRKKATRAGVALVVNDRFDLALLAEADGVHLGQSDLAPSRIPPDARERLAVGRSTHDLAQARRAVEEGARYIAFGPVFATSTKADAEPARGLEALAAVVRAVAPRPVIAIGGITAERARAVREAGAAGVAVISAVAGSAAPLQAVRDLALLFPREPQ